MWRTIRSTSGLLSLGVLAALLSAPARLAARTEVARDRRPNIVFILADDLGYGDLGCYGQKQIKTPNLDRLAAHGRRFTQCYAGSTVCAPSRCCLMTGLHTGHARIRGNNLIPLRPGDVTVAEVLKQAGYATGIFGKWGLGEPDTSGLPNRQGFDEFFGFLNQGHAHNYYPAYLWKNEQKLLLSGNVAENGISSERAQYAPDLFARNALDFLDRHKAVPFFLFFTPTLPHANNELGKMEGNGMEVPSDAPYSGEPWPQPQKNHAAMITRLDGDVGKVLARLRELGLEENTIVFFTSDNGPHKEGGADPAFFKSSGALRGFKRAMYEGGIRVPMIVRWPGKVPAGTVSDAVWAFWDVLPTLAALAGASTSLTLDGIDITTALVGNPPPRHDFLYWEFHEGGFRQAVRVDDWKAVRLAPSKPLELYNLKVDQGEAHNIAADQPGVVTRIEAYLKIARTE
jgi:arylsulfatase A-like enzyme